MQTRVGNPVVSIGLYPVDVSPLVSRRLKTTGLKLALGLGGSVLVVGSIALTRVFGGVNLAEFLAIFLASTLSSIAGFAFSAICGAMLFHIEQEPLRIVQVMIVCSIAIQLF